MIVEILAVTIVLLVLITAVLLWTIKKLGDPKCPPSAPTTPPKAEPEVVKEIVREEVPIPITVYDDWDYGYYPYRYPAWGGYGRVPPFRRHRPAPHYRPGPHHGGHGGPGPRPHGPGPPSPLKK